MQEMSVFIGKNKQQKFKIVVDNPDLIRYFNAMKTKYTLTPQCEGHEMPCRVNITTSKSEALKIASRMAGEIYAALLAQCDISVMVQTESESLRGDAGVLAWHDGRFVNGVTGDFVRA